MVDDFSLDDTDSDLDDGSKNSDEMSRASSVESNQSLNIVNIRRNKGKHILSTHSNNCQETLILKVD